MAERMDSELNQEIKKPKKETKLQYNEKINLIELQEVALQTGGL